MGTRNMVFAMLFALTLGTIFVASPVSADLSECKQEANYERNSDRGECSDTYRTSRCDDEACRQRTREQRQRCYSEANARYDAAIARCQSTHGN